MVVVFFFFVNNPQLLCYCCFFFLFLTIARSIHFHYDLQFFFFLSRSKVFVNTFSMLTFSSFFFSLGLLLILALNRNSVAYIFLYCFQHDSQLKVKTYNCIFTITDSIFSEKTMKQNAIQLVKIVIEIPKCCVFRCIRFEE